MKRLISSATLIALISMVGIQAQPTLPAFSGRSILYAITGSTLLYSLWNKRQHNKLENRIHVIKPFAHDWETENKLIGEIRAGLLELENNLEQLKKAAVTTRHIPTTDTFLSTLEKLDSNPLFKSNFKTQLRTALNNLSAIAQRNCEPPLDQNLEELQKSIQKYNAAVNSVRATIKFIFDEIDSCKIHDKQAHLKNYNKHAHAALFFLIPASLWAFLKS